MLLSFCVVGLQVHRITGSYWSSSFLLETIIVSDRVCLSPFRHFWESTLTSWASGCSTGNRKCMYIALNCWVEQKSITPIVWPRTHEWCLPSALSTLATETHSFEDFCKHSMCQQSTIQTFVLHVPLFPACSYPEANNRTGEVVALNVLSQKCQVYTLSCVVFTSGLLHYK